MDIIKELSRAINRERLQKPCELSAVEPDFFRKVNEAMNLILREVEREEMSILLESFIAIRIPKIARMASTSSVLPSELDGKLTIEETDMFISIKSAVLRLKLEALK